MSEQKSSEPGQAGTGAEPPELTTGPGNPALGDGAGDGAGDGGSEPGQGVLSDADKQELDRMKAQRNAARKQLRQFVFPAYAGMSPLAPVFMVRASVTGAAAA